MQWQRWRADTALQGKKVAELKLSDLAGDEQTVDLARGEPTAIVFWATWCGPCTVELSRINQAVIDGELEPRSLYAVSIGEDPAIVLQTVKDRDYRFPVYVDPNGGAATQFAVAATPTTVLVDRNGQITDVSSGMTIFPVSAIREHLAMP